MENLWKRRLSCEAMLETLRLGRREATLCLVAPLPVSMSRPGRKAVEQVPRSPAAVSCMTDPPPKPHCPPPRVSACSLAGVSRSVTLVIAYIMTVTDFGWEDALHTVRAGRSCANPNLGFQRQLQEFEQHEVHQVSHPWGAFQLSASTLN